VSLVRIGSGLEGLLWAAGMLSTVWAIRFKRVGCCACMAVLVRLAAVSRPPASLAAEAVVVRRLIRSGLPQRLGGGRAGACAGTALLMV
jgi:hypothetical protein